MHAELIALSLTSGCFFQKDIDFSSIPTGDDEAKTGKIWVPKMLDKWPWDGSNNASVAEVFFIIFPYNATEKPGKNLK